MKQILEVSQHHKIQRDVLPLSLSTIGFLVILAAHGGGPGPVEGRTDAPALLALFVGSIGGPPPRPPGLMWSYLKQKQAFNRRK